MSDTTTKNPSEGVSNHTSETNRNNNDKPNGRFETENIRGENCVGELMAYYLKDEIEHYNEMRESGYEVDDHIVGKWLELLNYLNRITQDDKYRQYETFLIEALDLN